MNEEIMYHIGLPTSIRAKYAILPGDPGRVPKIAAYLDEPQELGFNREFRTWAGRLDGETVLVTSTGIDGPSAAIAVEELIRLGVDTFVRVGTCGGMNEKVCAGDVVIATGAIRMEGTSREYLPIEFPAVADFGLVRDMAEGAKALGLPFHTGVVQSKDSFYGQHSLRYFRSLRQGMSGQVLSFMWSGIRSDVTNSVIIPNHTTPTVPSERRLRD